MCGRYASARSVDDIASAFGISADDVEDPPAPDWNIAPTKPVAAVLERAGRRVLTQLRWGLVPSWAPDPSVGARMINARLETISEKPAFRDALRRRRCLLPADGWYEWQARPDGLRQPHYLRPEDGHPLAFAGLWETWHDADGRAMHTAVIVTAAAPADLRHVHDRAPVVLPASAWDRWLDDQADPWTVLVPTPAGAVVAVPVGDGVGDVGNNSPDLIRPVTVAEQPTLF